MILFENLFFLNIPLIHTLMIPVCVLQLIFLTWIDFLQTLQMIDFWISNCFFNFVDISLLMHMDERLFMLIFRIYNRNWKDRSFCLWLPWNIGSQKPLVNSVYMVFESVSIQLKSSTNKLLLSKYFISNLYAYLGL